MIYFVKLVLFSISKDVTPYKSSISDLSANKGFSEIVIAYCGTLLSTN